MTDAPLSAEFTGHALIGDVVVISGHRLRIARIEGGVAHLEPDHRRPSAHVLWGRRILNKAFGQ